jgi:hypothetical protein
MIMVVDLSQHLAAIHHYYLLWRELQVAPVVIPIKSPSNMIEEAS